MKYHLMINNKRQGIFSNLADAEYFPFRANCAWYPGKSIEIWCVDAAGNITDKIEVR